MSEQNQTNTMAGLSLTLGILAIVLPFIGLVIGIIGIILARKTIKGIQETGASGKGMATSGFVCSIVGVIIQCLLAVFVFLGISLFIMV
ncbi:DUF4190 domain-containing protein [Thalassobacillus sp. CUG 92003]|uniref:DUF4190 domain-containing protein n=1 Tax=Thalassobacillus sp. CUG 92003 TaxID=2736641 RepID=UPI0015E648DE|nr:DUF4190 domain-containing protein [Thalassobacillus sp. CUG 92003]